MALRNCTVKFGELVSLPLKKMGAIEETTTFVNLCVGQPDHPKHPPSPRKMPSVCAVCGPVTDPSVLIKGIDNKDGTYTTITQDEVAEVKTEFASEHKGEISLVAHPAGPFYASTAPGESVSYLIPGSAAIENQYKTMVAFIEAHPELVFVGLHTPQSVTSLYQVTVRAGVLVMEQRKRTQELREVPSVGGEPMVKLGMFLDMTLEDSLSDYDPEAYEDKYAAAIAALAEDTSRLVEGVVGTDAKPAAKAAGKGLSDAQMAEKLAALSTGSAKAKKAAKSEEKAA